MNGVGGAHGDHRANPMSLERDDRAEGQKATQANANRAAQDGAATESAPRTKPARLPPAPVLANQMAHAHRPIAGMLSSGAASIASAPKRGLDPRKSPIAAAGRGIAREIERDARALGKTLKDARVKNEIAACGRALGLVRAHQAQAWGADLALAVNAHEVREVIELSHHATKSVGRKAVTALVAEEVANGTIVQATKETVIGAALDAAGYHGMAEGYESTATPFLEMALGRERKEHPRTFIERVEHHDSNQLAADPIVGASRAVATGAMERAEAVGALVNATPTVAHAAQTVWSTFVSNR